MILLFENIIFNMTSILSLIFVLVFLGNLNGINPSSWITSLIIFMMFVFLKSLGLRLTYVSKQGIVGLSLVFVSILVFSTDFFFVVFG